MATLNTAQAKALEILKTNQNVFLTGAAGSGKSFLLSHFLKDQSSFPVLASTGAAAILIGGRTFHSFFGLGILEKGVQATIERALNNRLVVRRLQKTHGVVIDEISMLSSQVLRTAEKIAQKARNNTRPWGGLRVIAVGDFAQLPPVNPFGGPKDWAFLDEVWTWSEFRSITLTEVMRTTESDFLEVLDLVRQGTINVKVKDFLNSRTVSPPEDFQGTRLFPRRNDVEKYNLDRLDKIESPSHTFSTLYIGKEKEVEQFKKNAPISESITLKEKALVMLRQNDPEGRWVNGSLGHVLKISDEILTIALLNGRKIYLEKTDFKLLDAEGNPVVTARNFPLSLAWAVTIHKAQGTTLDQMQVDLKNLWEPGQAYVALSRVRSASGLYIEGWNPSSIKTDPQVVHFHRRLEAIS